MTSINHEIAERLDEVAQILEEQGANSFRVRAYRRAADVLRDLRRSVREIFDTGGLPALEALPGIGESLARSIRELLRTGRLPMLERLRGESDPVALFRTVPGIGRRTAEKLHELGLESLEELEAAAHDGRLEGVAGFGPKRLAGVRESLAQRLARVRRAAAPALEPPPVAELLDVDAEYRARASAGSLPRVAPRRLNPTREAWLPVLHTQRADRHYYTALYSNTPRAHRFRATGDWVVVYLDSGGGGQWAVITARHGALAGRRIVRGREADCASHYGLVPETQDRLAS